MWEYKVRKTANSIDIAGAYGYASKASAIKAFKRRFTEWQKFHCIIYAPGYKPCAEKAAGEVKFN